MKIYTRGGDAGETSLLGPDRVRKDDARIEAYGTVDELSSFIGAARASFREEPLDSELAEVQSDLFQIGAWLASTGARVETVPAERTASLERSIDRMEQELEPLRSFILPGGSSPAANLHIARTVCRRAERRVVSLGTGRAGDAATIAYLNRLSDYLFVAARWANRRLSVEDIKWHG